MKIYAAKFIAFLFLIIKYHLCKDDSNYKS